MVKKRDRDEIFDDEGNVLEAPPPDSDVGRLIYLLEYARKRGFRIGPGVKVGDVETQVIDIRQTKFLAEAGRQGSSDITPGSDMAVLLGSDEGDE